MVLPEVIETSTSPLPRECSTTELRQHGARGAPQSARPLATERRATQPHRRKAGPALFRRLRGAGACEAQMRPDLIQSLHQMGD
jgi:hypothetical protein